MKYTVVLEKAKTSWRASVPDLPGCVAVGESRDEASSLACPQEREIVEFLLCIVAVEETILVGDSGKKTSLEEGGFFIVEGGKGALL